MDTSLNATIARYQARLEKQLEALFDDTRAYDTSLIDAMRYSLLDGGKRLRPLLAYAAAEAIAHTNEATDHFACALECVHVYSLIHDDLPAMDDDDLRRGKPSCHKAYDEATAILAGDALQALAFEILALAPEIGAEQKLSAVSHLTRASGMQGMVLGQAIDLSAVNEELTLPQLETMHLHKTGALIEASVVLGAISVNASASQLAAMQGFARSIGLAFQVQDDILDVTSDTQTLGKAQGADIKNNKPTYVSLLGLDEARAKAVTLKDDAIAALAPLGERAELLRRLADYIIQRAY